MTLKFLNYAKIFRQLSIDDFRRHLNYGVSAFNAKDNVPKIKDDTFRHSYQKKELPFYKEDELQPEKSIVFDTNADHFGTLSSDRMMREKVECEEDDGDVVETNYIDGIKGKTRLQPVNYAMMIKDLLQQKKLADALAVLDKTMLLDHKAKPDLYIYNLLISGCAMHGYTKKAFNLFNQMKKRGIRPRLSTYTSLFNACAHGPWAHDSLERARYLREHMKEKGVEPNHVNYNAMIKAFGRHGDIETSFLIMDEMVSKKIAIDSLTFNFLLQSAASDKEAGFRHALLLWKKMMEKKILPTIYTFNLLLRCTRDCGTGDSKATQELILSLYSSQKKIEGERECNEKPLGIQHENSLLVSSSSGALVSVKSGLNKPWDRLLLLGNLNGVLSMMGKFKAQPDIKTCSLLLDILPNSDELEEALLQEMTKRNIQIDRDFCNMLIKKRNSSNRYSSALDVLNLMAKNKLETNIVTFGVLALGCHTLKAANQLLRDIKDIGFRVNIEILTVLITRAKVSLDIDMVLLVINTLKSEDITPDKKFYHKLTQFRDIGYLNLEAKEHGRRHLCRVDSEDFPNKFSKFLKHMEHIQHSIKDPSTVHPWEQFKAPLNR